MDFSEHFEHLNYVHDAVFVLNDAREIVFGNTVAITRFGQHRLGQDIVHIIRNPDCLDLVNQALNRNRMMKKSIAIGSPVNGLFDVQATRFAGPDPKEFLVLLSLHDTTETQQAAEMRSDFVANVSHELRSPLSTISGFIETLQGPAKDDPAAQKRFLELMSQEAGRMVRLIADLLSLSKVEANQRNRPRGQVDIIAVIKNVQAMLSKQAKDERKTIHLEVAHDIGKIPGHEDELIQVVQNLVENAIKYSAPDSVVTVKVTKETSVAGISGPAVSLAVCDEGEGIAKQHLSRLTERFYRVDSHRSRNDGGTGLGLAIIKHIVQHHRGRLKIESEVGKGSTFTVLLPAQHSAAGNNPQAVTKL